MTEIYTFDNSDIIKKLRHDGPPQKRHHFVFEHDNVLRSLIVEYDTTPVVILPIGVPSTDSQLKLAMTMAKKKHTRAFAS